MKAALVQPEKNLKVADCPTPEPGPGELVIRVAYCGVCGTDIHMLDAGLLPSGCIIGHELSGRVAALGKGVEGWREGEPVAVLPLDPCLSCEPCARGAIMHCLSVMERSYGLGMNPGGFSEYMRVKPSMLCRIPDGLDLRTAALNEPWSVALHGVNRSEFRTGKEAVVMGAGPIGLLCMAALRGAGASRIYVSEPDPFRADRARAAGADLVVDPGRESPGGLIREKAERFPETVFDCAGASTSLEEAAAMAGPHGRVVALGIHTGNTSLFPMLWFLKEIRLDFCLGYTWQEFSSGLDLLAGGAVNPDIVISDVMPLADIQHAFRMLHGSGHTKILIDCQGA